MGCDLTNGRWCSRLPRLVLASCACLAAWPVAAAGPDDVIARCGSAAIRRADLEAVVKRLGLADLPPGEGRARAEAAILEQLIDERVLREELTRLGVTATQVEIDAGLRRLRDQVSGRGQDFEAFLAATGRTTATIRDQIALEIKLEKFVRPQVTEEVLAAAFEKNRREFDGTKLRVSHIVLRPEAGGGDDPTAPLLEEAAALRGRIIQGRLSFQEAARLHSAGPSRRRGGDLGWIGRGGPMVEGFSSQAYRLAQGGVSQPFVTPFGVHLVTVTAVEPGRIGLDAVRTRLEKLLAAQIVRGLVVAGRRRAAVAFAPGVAHFDPATVGAPAEERAVMVEADAGGGG
jgi:parvulin-like peptidyl-prolyl isomerase